MLTIEKLVDEINNSDNCLDWRFVGSSVTCDPPVMDTDIDVLILLKERDRGFLSGLGFYLDNTSIHYEPNDGVFNSWRRENFNLIVTDSTDFFDAFVVATKVARKFNLLKKEDRIILFQAVLYRNFPTE